MTTGEIKKTLYKDNPEAEFAYIIKGVAVYESYIGPTATRIVFAVPVSDMGDAAFGAKMKAKHLIRYLTTPASVSEHIKS